MREGLPPTTCRLSRVTCHVSRVTSQLSQLIFFDKVVKLVGEGYVINGLPRLVCLVVDAPYFILATKNKVDHKLSRVYQYLWWS